MLQCRCMYRNRFEAIRGTLSYTDYIRFMQIRIYPRMHTTCQYPPVLCVVKASPLGVKHILSRSVLVAYGCLPWNCYTL